MTVTTALFLYVGNTFYSNYLNAISDPTVRYLAWGCFIILALLIGAIKPYLLTQTDQDIDLSRAGTGIGIGIAGFLTAPLTYELINGFFSSLTYGNDIQAIVWLGYIAVSATTLLLLPTYMVYTA